jgi:hypothetical protein
MCKKSTVVVVVLFIVNLIASAKSEIIDNGNAASAINAETDVDCSITVKEFGFTWALDSGWCWSMKDTNLYFTILQNYYDEKKIGAVLYIEIYRYDFDPIVVARSDSLFGYSNNATFTNKMDSTMFLNTYSSYHNAYAVIGQDYNLYLCCWSFRYAGITYAAKVITTSDDWNDNQALYLNIFKGMVLKSEMVKVTDNSFKLPKRQTVVPKATAMFDLLGRRMQMVRNAQLHNHSSGAYIHLQTKDRILKTITP